jgi:hypothetical protein
MSRGSTSVQTSSCGCAPVTCGDCGGLECLCRSRFFAGQLLTDEDLTRLDSYIRAKNRLHNRYLVGWGVACGLEVVCNPCDGTVAVRPGYALSPCGDDIVVCNETSVDVCSLIQQCKTREPRNCLPAQTGSSANDPCSNTPEKWILSIHYDETPTRGVFPLKNTGSAACCSKCACGGSSSCGCACHSASSPAGGGCNGTTKTTTPAPQCEPTVVCEGYRFAVCKVIAAAGTTAKPPGAIVQRFLCCYQQIIALISAPPTDPQQLQTWCCTIKNNLLDYLADNPGHTCTIPGRLATLCQAGSDVQTIKSDVTVMVEQFLLDCFCSIFLPPCPCPVDDASVPLATVTISRKDGVCRVVSICNLDVRKFLVTLPNLGYWLSAIPLNLRDVLARLCCTPLKFRQVQFGDQSISRSPFLEARSVSSPPPDDATDIAAIAALAFSRRSNPADLQTLAMAGLGLTDSESRPFLSDTELRHPLETIVLNQFGVPALETLLGKGQPTDSTTGAPTPAATAAAAPAAAAAESPDLRKEVDDLKAQLKSTQAELRNLARKIN